MAAGCSSGCESAIADHEVPLKSETSFGTWKSRIVHLKTLLAWAKTWQPDDTITFTESPDYVTTVSNLRAEQKPGETSELRLKADLAKSSPYTKPWSRIDIDTPASVDDLDAIAFAAAARGKDKGRPHLQTVAFRGEQVCATNGSSGHIAELVSFTATAVLDGDGVDSLVSYCRRANPRSVAIGIGKKSSSGTPMAFAMPGATIYVAGSSLEFPDLLGLVQVNAKVRGTFDADELVKAARKCAAKLGKTDSAYLIASKAIRGMVRSNSDGSFTEHHVRAIADSPKWCADVEPRLIRDAVAAMRTTEVIVSHASEQSPIMLEDYPVPGSPGRLALVMPKLTKKRALDELPPPPTPSPS